MALLSTKVKNIVMVCAALTVIVGSAVYIIGGQQKIGGLRHHRRDDGKVSRALRFMSPVPWPDMGKEKERKSLDRAQYAADHHEDERNLGKRNNKKKQKKKKKKKNKKPKTEKSQSLKGSTATTASVNTIKDMAVAVVESSSEPKSSKSDKAMTNTKEELTSYTLPFQKDTSKRSSKSEKAVLDAQPTYTTLPFKEDTEKKSAKGSASKSSKETTSPTTEQPGRLFAKSKKQSSSKTKGSNEEDYEEEPSTQSPKSSKSEKASSSPSLNGYGKSGKSGMYSPNSSSYGKSGKSATYSGAPSIEGINSKSKTYEKSSKSKKKYPWKTAKSSKENWSDTPTSKPTQKQGDRESPTTPSPTKANTPNPTPSPSNSPVIDKDLPEITSSPSQSPSANPSQVPTNSPSSNPSKQPSVSPSRAPTSEPTSSPSKAVIANDNTQPASECCTPVPVNVTLNDIYPPNANLTVTISNQASNGNCTVEPVNQVVYTPNSLSTGQDSCEYTLCDSVSNSCDTANVYVEIGEPAAPEAIDDEDITPFNEAVTVAVLANDTQPEGLALDVRNITTDATNGTCVKDGDGVKYTPNAGFVGIDTCVYTACVTGSNNACDTATLTITVWAAPTSNPTQSPSNQPTSTPSHSPSLSPSKVPSQSPSSVPTGSPSKEPTSSPSQSPSANPSQVPTSSPSSNPSKQPSVSPSRAPTSEPTSSPSKAVIANDNTQPASECCTPVPVNVTLNDIYPPNANLTVTISNQASNGNCTVEPVNQVVYTPNSLSTGQDSCEYTLCDSVSNSCDTANVYVEIGEPAAPEAIDDEDITPFNEAVTVAVLANDTQPEGLALDVRNITTDATNGTCVKDGDGVKYTPNAGFVGIDTCVYTACVTGSNNACDTATLTITVWAAPTSNPTQSPSNQPTSTPSHSPSLSPSKVPSQSPSSVPTGSPSKEPTSSPSQSPSANPSQVPTSSPSSNPSKQPSNMPSASPSKGPSVSPTKAPTSEPTSSPTESCSNRTFFSGLSPSIELTSVGETLTFDFANLEPAEGDVTFRVFIRGDADGDDSNEWYTITADPGGGDELTLGNAQTPGGAPDECSAGYTEANNLEISQSTFNNIISNNGGSLALSATAATGVGVFCDFNDVKIELSYPVCSTCPIFDFNVCIALDESSSVENENFGGAPGNYNLMKDFAISIVEELRDEVATTGSTFRSSVVEFADGAVVSGALTDDPGTTIDNIDDLVHDGTYTNHEAAIVACQSTLPTLGPSSEEKNFILFVTDGDPNRCASGNCCSTTSNCAAAQTAATSTATSVKNDGTIILPVFIEGNNEPISQLFDYMDGISSNDVDVVFTDFPGLIRIIIEIEQEVLCYGNRDADDNQ